MVSSADERFSPGDWVTGVTGIQEYALIDAGGLTAIDTSLAAPETYLGALGISGMTAYFGLLDVGRPEPGQTVAVSGAAGSVGSLVGQIARIRGCRAVGIAGGPGKCDWLTGELDFDAAVDYRAGELRAALKTAAPEGIDVFFDNVGGRDPRCRADATVAEARGSSSAERYRSTTPPTRWPARATTCPCSSSARQ